MPATAPVRLTPGQTVGPYRIASVSAQGVVAEAIDPASHRRLAIKQLPFDLVTDAAAWQKFHAFVESMRAWKNVHAVELIGAETLDGRAYLLMEHLAGGSLADIVATTGRLPWRTATQRAIEAGRTIAAAHTAGIVHGSIRPSNLFIGADGTLKVSDFSSGLVRPRTGDYSAPERFAGKPADAAGDVYSLGATLFALLSGHAPFADAATEAEIAQAHASRPIPNVRAGIADMPLRCELIVQRAMAKKPVDRYPNVASLVAELESLLRPERAPQPVSPTVRPGSPRPHPRRRPINWQRWLTPAALVAFLGGATYLTFFRSSPPTSKSQSKEHPASARPTVQNGISMRLVELPAATVVLGDQTIADAKPHLVRISKPFMIGQMEVLQREYELVMGVNPSRYPSETNPVEQVSWHDAVEFCKRLSQNPVEKEAGRIYRLPTEAEWEFACRAGTKSEFAFGPILTAKDANFGGMFGRTSPGDTYPANPWGIHDMHGNVWEWCADWYNFEYYLTAPAIDPAGPIKGTKRAVRGGAFITGPDGCRSAARNGTFAPDHRGPEVGFRVVCTFEKSKN